MYQINIPSEYKDIIIDFLKLISFLISIYITMTFLTTELFPGVVSSGVLGILFYHLIIKYLFII